MSDEAQTATFAIEAVSDIESAVAWVARDNQRASEQLQEAILRAGRLIGRNPLMGRPAPPAVPSQFRFFSVPRLPYLIIYDTSTEPPVILRVLHTSRDLDPIILGISQG